MWNLIAFILVVLIIAVFGAAVVGFYYNLVKLRDGANTAWSNIYAELERMISLTDKLIKKFGEYTENETSTLGDVVKSSYTLTYAETMQENAEAHHNLSLTLDNLLVAAENYPDLNSDKEFLKLTDQLEENEYLITDYGQYYDDLVYRYKNKCQTFPTNIIASYFGFEDLEFFETREKVENIHKSE